MVRFMNKKLICLNIKLFSFLENSAKKLMQLRPENRTAQTEQTDVHASPGIFFDHLFHHRRCKKTKQLSSFIQNFDYIEIIENPKYSRSRLM